VANGGGDSVTVIDALTGTPLRVISGAAYKFLTPQAMTVARGHLFVANGTGGSVTELPAS